MLILRRKVGESFRIGDDIVVKVGHLTELNVKLLIDAPRNVPIYREEQPRNVSPACQPLQYMLEDLFPAPLTYRGTVS
ncbi:MAG: carbon storage regulator [Planctomycetaceae bacterium]|nr:carbon storage regulator [Planctomycetaceae bacterium]